MTDDPERLLAEALRAQARNAPPAGPSSPRREPPPVVETPGGYGLLSGAGEGSLERERAALDALAQPDPVPAQPKARQPEPLSLYWILLLTLLLGLASGCVIGLLTLL
ncbi:hypothetical protein DI005_31320 [Prauserella sp. PE36]|uniref:DUF3040 domain-containing protein n=1 Tax=Prauserella endophytica TaxID=1592324 RepID=A0ABY2SB88_9PSEU|nr:MULTISPECIES: hypothetical protein [Prauserella]PXY34609.1 hypothetical protein BAY59_03570 [Prauserella coralliicola]RBM12936.1 hypothetical protein DI005_31320 [Prauserella sp. PE36]TKG73147.1 hypothetical protein FCN18_00675 [Prauserella endophytica]